MGSNSGELSWFVITVENGFLSWPSSVWESDGLCTVKVVDTSVGRKVREICLYSVENHEVGTRAQPMFLSETVSIMSLSFLRL